MPAPAQGDGHFTRSADTIERMRGRCRCVEDYEATTFSFFYESSALLNIC
jgi:hypothetical protein